MHPSLTYRYDKLTNTISSGLFDAEKLVGSVSKVDEQFKSAQENLRSLDEKISKSIEKGTAQPSRYYEDIASKSKLAADKLGSLHKEILQRVEQNRKADNLDLVDKLETILKETPPHSRSASTTKEHVRMKFQP
ncbi:hypothetical protein Pst134EB_019885 [Puccinia striiformis f. sp. tritici]|nr:hypothetical protein Pst134EB_019885 [Puccinia striiformis f. sp. tritici]